MFIPGPSGMARAGIPIWVLICFSSSSMCYGVLLKFCLQCWQPMWVSVLVLAASVLIQPSASVPGKVMMMHQMLAHVGDLEEASGLEPTQCQPSQPLGQWNNRLKIPLSLSFSYIHKSLIKKKKALFLWLFASTNVSLGSPPDLFHSVLVLFLLFS